MKLKGWRDVPDGGLIIEPGNSEEYHTGGWRTYRPVFNADNCIQCLFCFYYCPDSAIVLDDAEEKVVGIDYEHCKGCGICAAECPGRKGEKALVMHLESEFRD